MTEYDVVFDIARAGYAPWWWFPLAGAIPFVFVLALARFRTIVEATPRARWFPVVVLVFGIAWVGGAGVAGYREYRELLTAATSGDAEMVEGTVERLEALDAPSDEVERLVVAGRTFEYSDAEATSAFNQTLRRGGPLRPGQWIRVWHVEGRIVKIGIRRVRDATARPAGASASGR